MKEKSLSPEEAQLLIQQLQEQRRAKNKEATQKCIADLMQCSPAAVTNWKKRGIAEIRAMLLRKTFPSLPIWSEKKLKGDIL